MIGNSASVLAALSLLGGCSLLFDAPGAGDAGVFFDASVEPDAQADACELPPNLVMRASFDDTSAGLTYATTTTPSHAVVGLAVATEEFPCSPGGSLEPDVTPDSRIEIAHVPDFELEAATFRMVFRLPEAIDGQQALFDKDASNPNAGDVSLDILGDGTTTSLLVLRVQDGNGAGGDGLFLCSRGLLSGVYEARAYLGGGKPTTLQLRRWDGGAWGSFQEALETTSIVMFNQPYICGYEAATDAGIGSVVSLVDNTNKLSIAQHNYNAGGPIFFFSGLLLDFSLHSSRP